MKGTNARSALRALLSAVGRTVSLAPIPPCLGAHAWSLGSRAFAAPAARTAAKPAASAPGMSRKGKAAADGELTPKLKHIMDMLLPPQHQKGHAGMPVRTLPEQQHPDGSAGAGERGVKDSQAAAQAAFDARSRRYEEMQARLQQEWEQDMLMKHQLQRAALRALPKQLRDLAQQPDLEPFPTDRQFLLQTPPKAYGAGGDVEEASAPKRLRK